MLEPSGFCHKCGYRILDNFGRPIMSELFCSKKHKEQYERAQDRLTIRGKRASYGISGSTH
jgi:hypothetical protein